MLLVHRFVLIFRGLYFNRGFLWNPIYFILFILKHSKKTAGGFIGLPEENIRRKEKVKELWLLPGLYEKDEAAQLTASQAH